jgi:serine/threonine protein kinase
MVLRYYSDRNSTRKATLPWKESIRSIKIINKIMRKIQLNPSPGLKEANKWDKEYVGFIQSCLIKDPVKRPSAKELLEKSQKFFEKAKDSAYLKARFLKDVPEVYDRVFLILISLEGFLLLSHVKKQ